MMSSISSGEEHRGFSQNTCSPRLSAASTCSWCSMSGEPMTTASSGSPQTAFGVSKAFHAVACGDEIARGLRGVGNANQFELVAQAYQIGHMLDLRNGACANDANF